MKGSMFDEPNRKNGAQREILTNRLLIFSLSTIPISYCNVGVFDDRSLPRAGPPSKFYMQLEGRLKFLLESLGL